jgi:protein TonB
VLGAFALGLIAFLLVIRGRGDQNFFRADTVPPTSADRAYAPLPAPLPAGEGSGLQRVEAPVEDAPSAVVEEEPEVAPPPPPPPPAPMERPRPVETVTRQARPLPGQTPAPDYPRRALMRGEGGTALVIAYIGPDGVPTSTDLAQSSGSRELDRAAQSAVRRWRFEPAMENGRPTVGRVVVPIDFRPAP